MKPGQLSILLADDDMDDCHLFKEALESLPFPTTLAQFHYGDQLMQWFHTNGDALPDALFLDLNMPRKNGFQCLVEIRQIERLKLLPIFIISTSYEKHATDLLYQNGANFFIRKPSNFSELKDVIGIALTFVIKHGYVQPSKEKFLLAVG